MSNKLYSFDIFDTLITRKVATPTGIFAIMQQELKSNIKYQDLSSDFKENFYYYRTNAEFRQKRFNKLWKEDYDITLEQIYDDLKKTYGLSDTQCQMLMQLEIETEINNVIPIHINIVKVKNLLKEGKRVVLISDMYLPEIVINKMLQKCDNTLPTLKLYLSSNLGVRKSTAKLYEYVSEQENVKYSNWEHFGDNKHADYKQAKSLGIKATLYPYVSLKSYEKTLLNIKSQDAAIQLAIGCAKNIRLNNNNKTTKFQMGVSLGGGVLYPYISWILTQSQQRGIKRLYFVARDGYILKMIADTLIKSLNLDIKTEYLYGSRKAWRLPALSSKAMDFYNQYIKVIGEKSYNKLDEVFDIAKEELLKHIPQKFNYYDKGLTSRDKKQLKEFLLDNQDFLNLLVDKNKEKRALTIDYLKNTIDYSDNKFAFVEVDGTGFTQNCLCEFLQEFYNGPVLTFYLGSTLSPFEEHPNLIKSYFYNLKQPYMGMFLELLTKAPHGQTITYQKENGVSVPILEKQEIYDNLEDYRLGVITFANELLKIDKLQPHVCFQKQDMIEHYINFIYNKIDKENAEILGQIPHSFVGTESEEFAPKMNLAEALKYFFTGKAKTESILYTKLRSRKTVKKIIDLKQNFPNLRKELLNIYVNRKKKDAYIKILGNKISFRKILFIK